MSNSAASGAAPAQVVADLRTIVVRRTRRGRVALLSSDTSLAQALEQQGCTVLVDPDSTEALAAFAPDAIVAFDGFARDGAEPFKWLSTAAPGAQLVFSFANAASASAVVRGVCGLPVPSALAEKDVREWLAAAGYVVDHSDLVVTGTRGVPLATETEVALRQWLEQLNPAAAADRFVFTARRGAVASARARVSGLVSVVVTGDDSAGLERTLDSLLAQTRRPLEILVSASEHASLARLAAPKTSPQLTTIEVPARSSDWAVCTNTAIALASGQYLMCLAAGDHFSHSLLEQMTEGLRQGTRAWALAVDKPVPFDVSQWFEDEKFARTQWLIDRARVAEFSLSYAEGSAHAEALMFMRLSLLFAPEMVVAQCVSPRDAVDVGALLASLRGRPPRSLITLDRLVSRSDFGDLLERRLEEVRPGAGRPVALLRTLSQRLRQR